MRRYVATMTALLSVSTLALGDTHYVSTNGFHQWPYTNWASASTNILVAVQSGVDGDTVVVSNGIYLVGEQIVVTNAITIRSLKGRLDTIVDGCETTRCFWVDHPSAVVSGFTIQNGRSDGDGGGVWCGNGALVDSCIIQSNATPASGDGGGVYCYAATVRDCTIINNYASDDGGGIQCELNGIAERCWIADNTAADKGGAAVCRYGGVLRNCVMVGNKALCSVGDPVGVGLSGGAVYGRDGTIIIQHCTIVSNVSPNWIGGVSFYSGTIRIQNTVLYDNPGGNYDSQPSVVFSNCCTVPMPSGIGTGNITNTPAFVDSLQRNYHLSLPSPCIDKGHNIAISTDLELTIRPLDGDNDGTNATDIGAYEFVHPDADSDHDGQNDGHELTAGTSPVDPNSCLRVLNMQMIADQALVNWSTVNGRAYKVQVCTNLLTGTWTNAFPFSLAETNEQPEGTESVLIPANPENNAAFYRLVLDQEAD